MLVTTPPRTYTVTVNSAERELMRCALHGLANRLHDEVRSAEARAADGVNVEPFLTDARGELAAVRRMSAALYDVDEDADSP